MGDTWHGHGIMKLWSQWLHLTDHPGINACLWQNAQVVYYHKIAENHMSGPKQHFWMFNVFPNLGRVFQDNLQSFAYRPQARFYRLCSSFCSIILIQVKTHPIYIYIVYLGQGYAKERLSRLVRQHLKAET